MEEKKYYTYMIKCADGTLYTGWTTDLQKRLASHNSGKGAKYTRPRRPVRLVYYEAFAAKREAMRREWGIKQLTKEQKLQLIANRERNMMLKRVEVAAAIIQRDGRILATQRGYGKYKDFWEFPGGKLEEGETPEQALAREIREELDTELTIGELFDTVEYDYPDFHLTMYCFLCTVKEGNLVLKEHEAARWVTAEDIKNIEWLPADRDLIGKLNREYFDTDPVL